MGGLDGGVYVIYGCVLCVGRPVERMSDTVCGWLV